jgi:hypothetical protein
MGLFGAYVLFAILFQLPTTLSYSNSKIAAKRKNVKSIIGREEISKGNSTNEISVRIVSMSRVSRDIA